MPSPAADACASWHCASTDAGTDASKGIAQCAAAVAATAASAGASVGPLATSDGQSAAATAATTVAARTAEAGIATTAASTFASAAATARCLRANQPLVEIIGRVTQGDARPWATGGASSVHRKSANLHRHVVARHVQQIRAAGLAVSAEGANALNHIIVRMQDTLFHLPAVAPVGFDQHWTVVDVLARLEYDHVIQAKLDGKDARRR